MLRKDFLVLLTFTLLGSGCGSSPTAPEGRAAGIVATGPEVLRIVYQSPCTGLGQGVVPLVYTRVNVAASSNEWVATAGSASAGDVQIRFRQSGQGVIPGSLPVAGTITGTAIHMPDLFPGPAWDIRASFSGSASLTGVAFAAGAFGATASGVGGAGSGSVAVTDATGNACTGTSFSWSILPVP